MQAIRYLTALGLCCVLGTASGGAQVPAATTPPATDEAVRVFLDCNTFCDSQFILREITYINWVRDRADADVHLIITSQSTGGGGQEYTLRYIGLRAFRGADDELKFTTRQSDTEDEIRRQQTKRIGLGLVRYVARGSFADRLALTYTAPASVAGGSATQKPRDPWNLWVFRLSLNTFLDGQSQSKSSYFSGNVGATRVAEDWKLSLSIGANRSNSSYTLNDSSVYKSRTSSYNASSLLVRSLGNHWSVGLQSNAQRSTFDNYNLNIRVTPEIEFNLFPYKESSKRQLVLVYAAGLTHANYRDTTIYLKLVETLPIHRLTIAAEAVQPWGNLSGSLGFSNYLNDFSKNRISLNGGASFQLIRGLRFNFYGNYSRVRDQLSLLKEGASDQEILLRLKQLKTSYFYFIQAGISYTFGSKFNNIVNPRFGIGGGEGGHCC